MLNLSTSSNPLTHTLMIKSAAGIVRAVEVPANALDAASYVRAVDANVRVGIVPCDDADIAESVRAAETAGRDGARALVADRKASIVANCRSGKWGDAMATMKAAQRLAARARRI